LPEDASAAARIAGADLLITGLVSGINLSQSSISIGALSIGNALADVSLEAEIIDAVAETPLFALFADGFFEGSTELTIDDDALGGSSNTCVGGLRADRDGYYGGESVSIGFANPGPAAWHSVEVHSSTGTFLQWLGWQYTPAGGCSRWFWDQRDSFGSQVPPSVYVAKLWDGSSYVETTTFEIRPGVGLLPLVDAITVGSQAFEDSIVGEAVDRAVEHLIGDLIPSLTSVAASIAGASAEAQVFAAEASPPPTTEGQVAALLPDGRIAINIGSSVGVSRGDFYDVLAADDLAYRGEIVVVEVRESVSYAVRLTDFDPSIGDIVRWVEP
jgi:hypothetical protein